MRLLRNKALSIATGLLYVLLAGGCAYHRASQQASAAFSLGDYAGAAATLEKAAPPDHDRLLHLLELGTCYHCAGDFAKSNARFLSAVSVAREYDERARVSLRDAAALGAALAINDNLLPYRGEPYERILLHTHLAMNYLLLRDLENARVEILQGYQVQKEMREQNEEAIAKSKAEASKRSWDSARINSEVDKAYAGQMKTIQSADNVYQNAFMYYLSSIVYEMNGEISDAYIDAKTVHALDPGFLPVRRELLRFARQLGVREEYDRWLAEFGKEMIEPLPRRNGEVVVLYARGLAPLKEQVKIVLPLPLEKRVDLVPIAFPRFVSRHDPVATVRLGEDCTVLGSTQPLMSVEATAERNLWQQAPALAIRQLIRAAGKVVLQEQARKKYGSLAFLAAFILADITEQADLRSWRSLPVEFQALRVSVPPGAHNFVMDLVSSQGTVVGSVPANGVQAPEGGIVFIVLRSVGVHGTAYHVSFSRRSGAQ